MANPNRATDESNAPKDRQDQYDSSIQEYENGQALETNDDGRQNYAGRFPRDFYKYSADFHDRENGAPGIDEDFGTSSAGRGREEILPNLMPEGDGVAETKVDREIREEIMDAFTHDTSLDADDVTVRVEDGVVTLSGTVLDSRMRQEIEDAVQSVPRVDEVVNCLILSPPAGSPLN